MRNILERASARETAARVAAGALARRLLDQPDLAAAWAERNYQLAARHFSFTILQRHLEDLLADCFGEAV